jgi:hypothetical protein
MSRADRSHYAEAVTRHSERELQEVSLEAVVLQPFLGGSEQSPVCRAPAVGAVPK